MSNSIRAEYASCGELDVWRSGFCTPNAAQVWAIGVRGEREPTVVSLTLSAGACCCYMSVPVKRLERVEARRRIWSCSSRAKCASLRGLVFWLESQVKSNEKGTAVSVRSASNASPRRRAIAPLTLGPVAVA